LRPASFDESVSLLIPSERPGWTAAAPTQGASERSELAVGALDTAAVGSVRATCTSSSEKSCRKVDVGGRCVRILRVAKTRWAAAVAAWVVFKVSAGPAGTGLNELMSAAVVAICAVASIAAAGGAPVRRPPLQLLLLRTEVGVAPAARADRWLAVTGGTLAAHGGPAIDAVTTVRVNAAD
jgi:hypothetical protein